MQNNCLVILMFTVSREIAWNMRFGIKKLQSESVSSLNTSQLWFGLTCTAVSRNISGFIFLAASNTQGAPPWTLTSLYWLFLLMLYVCHIEGTSVAVSVQDCKSNPDASHSSICWIESSWKLKSLPVENNLQNKQVPPPYHIEKHKYIVEDI